MAWVQQSHCSVLWELSGNERAYIYIATYLHGTRPDLEHCESAFLQRCLQLHPQGACPRLSTPCFLSASSLPCLADSVHGGGARVVDMNGVSVEVILVPDSCVASLDRQALAHGQAVASAHTPSLSHWCPPYSCSCPPGGSWLWEL